MEIQGSGTWAEIITHSPARSQVLFRCASTYLQPMQRPKTLGELKASGWASRSVRDELRANLIQRLRAKEEVFPGIVGYEDSVIPQLQNAVLSGHSFILLGLRGQAKTRIAQGAGGPAGRVGARHRGLGAQRGSPRPGDRAVHAAGRGARRRPADPLDAPLGALPGEAGDAGRYRGGPHRRRGSDQGGDAQADLRGPRGDPLRNPAPCEPRDLLRQRAPGPAGADPGRASEHPGGGGHPGARLPDPDAPGPRAGVHREPRGLHEPRQHHHAAAGPHRLPDPHALPEGAGAGHGDHRPGGLEGSRRRCGRGRGPGGAA